MFIPALRASTSRLPRLLPSAQTFSSSSQTCQKVPLGPTAEIPTPAALLSKIGRNADKKLGEKAESWESLNELWLKKGKLRDSGLAVKERRYLLWAMSKFSQGNEPSTFIRSPPAPKKYRGWGPKIQHGVRVR